MRVVLCTVSCRVDGLGNATAFLPQASPCTPSASERKYPVELGLNVGFAHHLGVMVFVFRSLLPMAHKSFCSSPVKLSSLKRARAGISLTQRGKNPDFVSCMARSNAPTGGYLLLMTKSAEAQQEGLWTVAANDQFRALQQYGGCDLGVRIGQLATRKWCCGFSVGRVCSKQQFLSSYRPVNNLYSLQMCRSCYHQICLSPD